LRRFGSKKEIPIELCDLGVFELARLYRQGDVSPVEVVNAHLQRCERLNPVLNAYLVLLHDSARQAAHAMEALFQAGTHLSPLQGVPVSVKDLIRVRGTRTTAGSRVLLQEPADQNDAWVVQRLRAAGAIIIGKTNLHEFATGDPESEGPFGLVQNPRRIGYHPGSSSSGAGAAAAAGLGVIAVGTDSGGSVRIPACLCGVAGLKPTTGRIPLEGVIPLSSTLDTIGWLGRRVSDLGAAMTTCADPLRAYSPEQRNQGITGWRMGIPTGKFFRKMQPVVAAAFENTLQLLRDMGCQLIDFNPPGIEAMPELVPTFIQADASAYHERYREREHLYGPGFRERVFPGREMKALTYITARQRQLELQEKWLKLGSQYDVLIVPSGPALAPPHGVSTIEIDGESTPFRALLARFTRPFNLLGWPALSVPNGVSTEGLPTGVQIVGPPDTESRLLIVGQRIEQALGLAATLSIEPHPRA
jgi:aspartyl-tRNA(Asn)/glutamyl-tRNA(Gln) amidotransferase subunit A